MSLYSWIITNKEVFEIIYALMICLICALIVVKTDRFFRLSLHQGIRYFRNAFLFYGIAFLFKYFLGIEMASNYSFAIKIIFEYLIVMAGFFLLYSLVWKKFEFSREEYASSLFNFKITLFHLMTVVIVILDYLWQTYFFMFLSQIAIFAYASVISFVNYRKFGKQHKFLKFYFASMLLGLAAWLLNLLVASYLEWNKKVLIDIGVINGIFFLLILYGVIKVTKIK